MISESLVEEKVQPHSASSRFSWDGVDHVAVVGEGNRDAVVAGEDGLSVAEPVGAGGGVPRVADGQVPVQVAQVLLLEGLADEPHGGPRLDALAVAGGYAGALLAAVLEGVEPEEGDPGDLLAGSVDPDYPAGFTRTVVCVRCSGRASPGTPRIQSDSARVLNATTVAL